MPRQARLDAPWILHFAVTTSGVTRTISERNGFEKENYIRVLSNFCTNVISLFPRLGLYGESFFERGFTQIVVETHELKPSGCFLGPDEGRCKLEGVRSPEGMN